MPPTYILARDHLERAVAILSGTDAQSRQLRLIVERTVSLLREIERRDTRSEAKIIEFAAFRDTRKSREGRFPID